MRVATFNVQNLRLRLRGGKLELDPAIDRDVSFADVPLGKARADRRETARVIAGANPDVLALQEVFDQPTLEHFHEHFLIPAGVDPYPVQYCNHGNDGAGSMAILSRHRPTSIVRHAEATGQDLGLLDLPEELRYRPIFRRDCLEINLKPVTIFVCHFKAPYPDEDSARIVRQAEARAVRRIIELRFQNPADARWIVLGDLNDPGEVPGESPAPLEELARSLSIDMSDRLPPEDRWTYKVPGTDQMTCPDRILLSPRIARENPYAVPEVIRTGMALSDPWESGSRGLDGQAKRLAKASDHALVYADLSLGPVDQA